MVTQVRLNAPGGPDMLETVDAILPPPGAGEIMIRQEAIGVNFLDIYFRTGLYKLPDLPAVLGSGNRLQQVFLNLFMNARDAMPSGGMLEVRTAAHNGTVEIEVADTGMGIQRENLARIFDPFFTTKATGRGTGLGLSVSYGIIKEHAGKIEVRSTPGKGTSFRLEFPAVRKAVHA